MGREIDTDIASEVQAIVREGLLHAQKMVRIASTDDFEEACREATPTEIQSLRQWAKDNEGAKIRQWVKIKIKRNKNLRDLTCTELKIMARRYLIPNWHLLTKAELIREIEHEKRKRLIGRD